MLKHLVGIEQEVWLQVGDLPKIPAIADEDLDRTDDEQTTAVHILRYELAREQVDALKGGAALAAGIDHDKCRVEIRPVDARIRQSLLADLD
jgi:hypothetical protein